MLSSITSRCIFIPLILFSSTVLYAAPNNSLTPAAATDKTALPPAFSDANHTQPAPAKSAKPSLTPIGIVIWTKGTIQALQPKETARTLSRRSPIYVSDVIKTDATSTGGIAFSDGGVISLRADTEFKIDEYNFKKDAAPAQEKSVMSIVKGGFRTITGSIPKQNPDGYKVNTPVATIGVRGTQYSTVVSTKNKGSVFKIDKGVIVVKNKSGSIEIRECDITNGTKCEPYAEVLGPDSKPVAVEVMPAEFSNEPPISPATAKDISDIGSVSGGSSTSGGGSSSSGNFCIG